MDLVDFADAALVPPGREGRLGVVSRLTGDAPAAAAGFSR
jgi:hypothetical protein